MTHILRHTDGSRRPAGYQAEGQAVFAVEPAIDGTVAGIALVDGDARQVPQPEGTLAVFLKAGRQVQRRDVGVEEGVVFDDA